MKQIFEQILISPHHTVLETLKIIDDAALEIALVVDESGRLLGTVTDGDIRRGLIRGISLETSIDVLMNKNPVTANQSVPDDELMFTMTSFSIKHLPIISSDNKIVKLVLLKDLFSRKTRPNLAVIMAGGLGSRLGPLTKNTPKPLLNVGDKPLLSTTVEQLSRHGIEKVFISINYKADRIKEYFAENPASGIEVNFLEEKEFLGTAGAISLLPEEPSAPFIVMNGDIVSPINFGNLLDYHQASNKSMTLCTREFNFQIPYGVVRLRGNELESMQEKPEHTIIINAGIYVLNPEVKQLVPENTSIDMPDLIEKVMKEQSGAACFPVADFWLDIGNPKDYSKAQEAFAKLK